MVKNQNNIYIYRFVRNVGLYRIWDIALAIVPSWAEQLLLDALPAGKQSDPKNCCEWLPGCPALIVCTESLSQVQRRTCAKAL